MAHVRKCRLPHVRAVRRDAAQRLRHPIVVPASRRTSTRLGETAHAAGASGGIKELAERRPPLFGESAEGGSERPERLLQ
jgi:hypothetical protein